FETAFQDRAELSRFLSLTQVCYAFDIAEYKMGKMLSELRKVPSSQKKNCDTMLFWDLVFEEVNCSDVLNYYRQIIEKTPSSISERNDCLDSFVTIVLLQGTLEYLEEADRYSKELINNLPNEWTVKGTRGCVLVEKGEILKGIELLTGVMENEEEPSARVISASYLALAYSHQGCPQKAREWLAVGRDIEPHCRLFSRAEKLLINNENLLSGR
ncbi:MAG: hypothetical protein AAF329_28825, partial [Cyanobacteria bacterium P01_A01_bin.17]